ncbi:MAG: hypothetical protein ACRDCB_07190 [Clostridium sp.]|uniref:hypothetical protein n=1 Tax=Clostridium TaxID=1485 RepID=UPI0021535A78|nr:hypothetical protein [Clostridium sp. LY3-2]MCR6516390.1 hypothetical protein [Clostridium sp. LY3-2]
MVIDLKSLLRNTAKSSLLVVGLGVIALLIINPKYVEPFVIGFLISLANFIIGGSLSEKSINSKADLKGLLLMVSFVIRIILVAGIGILLLLQNQYNIILYVIGYMSNFISLFMAIKYEERK